MSPSLQPATIEDKDIILDFVRQYHTYDGVPFDERVTESALLPLLQQSDAGRLWLIQLDGSTIGYVAMCFGYSIEFGGRDAFVDEMFILAEFRGKGIGRKVLEAVRSRAKALGVKALHLEVDRGNERAINLYRSLGYALRERYHLMSLIP
jgi:GNAT superfamily N-acetyltransferase